MIANHDASTMMPNLKKMLLTDALGRIGLNKSSESQGDNSAESHFSVFMAEAYAEKISARLAWMEK